MDFTDLAGLSAPATKLIKVLSSGMGTVYRPISIRLDAAANAKAIRMLGAANLEVEVTRTNALAASDASNKVVLAEASIQIEDRAQRRLQHREVRRQRNLEAIAEAAVFHLPDQVSSTDVEENWKTRFFNIAEDVSNADMQDIWGKILAGEVARPGTYSMRALEILKNLSPGEAETFQKLRHLATDSGYVLKIGFGNDLTEFGITFGDVLSMREAGLLADGDNLSVMLTIPQQVEYAILPFAGKALLIQVTADQPKIINFEVYVLTAVGIQLISLIAPEINMEYLRKIAVAYKDKGTFFVGYMGHNLEHFEKISSS